jgi:hypothetical protein
LSEDQHDRIVEFDAAHLDQGSAEISADRVAEADFLICRYGTNVLIEDELRSNPFYSIRTQPAPEAKRARVAFEGTAWGGFCWEPGEQGCVVVCHLETERCPFRLVGAER